MTTKFFTIGKAACAGMAGVALLGFVLAMMLAPASRADLRADARTQFERAVKMRTTLEGYLERDRSLDDYRRTVVAYRSVYLITPETEEAPPALVAEAELYEEMGRLYDRKYFQTAIDRYNFLLKQYPDSHLRSSALLAIANIQLNDLHKLDDAQASFREFAKRFPHSDKIAEAQQGLKEVAAQRNAPATAAPAVALAPAQAPAPSIAATAAREAESVSDPAAPPLDGQAVEPQVSTRRVSSVTEIRTWNSEGLTRVVVNLNDTIKYEAMRIPDRIYFDLYKAKLGPKLVGKTMDLQTGMLKSVRVAQNKPDVVRIVLDVKGSGNYNAFLLSNPYRLVIDVHDRALAESTKATPVAVPNPPSGNPAPVPVAVAVAAKASDPAINVTSVANGKAPAPTSQAQAPSLAVTAKPVPLPKLSAKAIASLQPPPEPKPTRDGQRSLTRALGLKISRIVIDPGHGGHDTGTIGPHGLMEKDLCLDVAFRLGNLIEQKVPGADVVYTRKDDTFIPLEERTAIANRAQADLFISIHANSSRDDSARGIETYYLNFASSAESSEVASRENAMAKESLHDLQDLIAKIARNDKLEESKELASDIQDSLTQRLQLVSRSERNRGVKKAPFVVLIGADMPSVLSEISFVSNPSDERLLRKTDQRQRIADGLYRGIASYLGNLNSLPDGHQKLVSNNPVEVGAVASNGNPK